MPPTLRHPASAAHTRRTMNRFPFTEGVFVYVPGLVVIATYPRRFWLGLTHHRASRRVLTWSGAVGTATLNVDAAGGGE